MQITDGLSNCGEFIDIVQSVGLTCVGQLKEVFNGLSCSNLVPCIGGWDSAWCIKDKGVCVIIDDKMLECDVP